MATRTIGRRLVLWSIAGVAAQGASRLATNVIIGRFAGVESLGHVGTISAASFAAALLGPTAFAAAQAKFVGRMNGLGDRNGARLLVGHLSAWGVLISLAISVSVGGWLGATLGLTEAISGLLVTLGACGYALGRSSCFLEDRNRTGVCLEIAVAIFGFAGASLLAWMGVAGGALLIPQAIALNAYAAYSLRPSLKLVSLPSEILEFVTLGSAATMASAGVLHLTILVSRLDGGTETAGLVSAALAVSTPLSFIAGATTSVLYPKISSMVGAEQVGYAHDLSRLATKSLFLFLVPVLGSVSYFAPELMGVLWGQPFAPAATFVGPMVAGILATAVAAPEVAMLTARSRAGVRQSTVASLTGTPAGIALWAVSLYLPGSQTLLVSYGYTISMFLTAVGSMIMLDRKVTWTSFCAVVSCFGIIVAPALREALPVAVRLPLGVVVSLTAGLIGVWFSTKQFTVRSTKPRVEPGLSSAP